MVPWLTITEGEKTNPWPIWRLLSCFAMNVPKYVLFDLTSPKNGLKTGDSGGYGKRNLFLGDVKFSLGDIHHFIAKICIALGSQYN